MENKKSNYMKRLINNVIRLLWYIPYRVLKFMRFGRVLNFPIGWDTLYPLAPYSEGGLLRKDFLELYGRETITTKEYHKKSSGKLIQGNYEFWQRKFTNQEYLKSWWI